MKTVAEARAERNQRLIEESVREKVGMIFSEEDSSWAAREQLTKLLSFFAQEKAPYRSCVRQMMPHLGPGRTESTCGTIKEMIRGTSRFRSDPSFVFSMPEVTSDVKELLLSINDDDLEQMMMEVAEHGRD